MDRTNMYCNVRLENEQNVGKGHMDNKVKTKNKQTNKPKKKHSGHVDKSR